MAARQSGRNFCEQMQAADSSGNDSEAESSEDEFDHASIHSMGRGRKVKVGGLLAHANVLCL